MLAGSEPSFSEGLKIKLRGRHAASRLSTGDARRRTFCPVIVFWMRPPRPPYLNVGCTSSSLGSSNYFGHWRHTPLPSIERMGARGAAAQVRFGKLNVIGVVCFTPLLCFPVGPFLYFPPSQPFLFPSSLVSPNGLSATQARSAPTIRTWGYRTGEGGGGAALSVALVDRRGL